MISTKVEKAIDLYKKGYNCAQAVVCAFCEECDIEEADAFRISEGFGSGMAMREICGAVSGMSMVIGLLNSVGSLEKGKSTKVDTYQKVRAYTQAFQDKNGSYICRELKSGKDGKPLCSCEQCVTDAVKLIEKYLEDKND